MNPIDQCLQRFALLDRADHLLNEVRLYGNGLPPAEAIAQHRAMLREARRHLESARDLLPAAA